MFHVAGISLIAAVAAIASSSPHSPRLSLREPPSIDSTKLCFVDATSNAPIIGVELRLVRAESMAPANKPGTTRSRSDCAFVDQGEWHVRRVGYRAQQIQISRAFAQGETLLRVALVPLSSTVALDTVRVSAPSPTVGGSLGHLSQTLNIATAQTTGAATTSQLIDRLPFTNSRSARGETGLSLRGARREQVVITLDGLPLNDPATGIADVSDLPLASLGTATVSLGADPIAAGPGASGGVLALTSAAQRVLSMRAGSLGQGSVEGAWSATTAHALVHASAMHRIATNNFVFDNTAGASGESTREHRINNDEARSALTLGVVSNAWQASALASHSDRGMVGPANVRTFDNDRARTDRVLARAQGDVGIGQLLLGARQLNLAYRDPTRPELDANARAFAVDAEYRGAMRLRSTNSAALRWRAGGGRDDVHATGGVSQTRDRGFGSLVFESDIRGVRTELGARLDVMDGAPTRPSFSAGLEHRVSTSWSLSARASQAMRAPTLYDLYFASPQRLYVKSLNAERVRIDAELLTRYAHSTSLGSLSAEVAAVARDTRDAIVWFPGNFGWSPANVGVERLRGIESRARLVPRWGDLSVWTTAYDAQLTTGALRIPTPYVPRVSGGAQLLARIRSATVSTQSRVMSRRPFSAGPRDRAYELPAVTLVDAALSHPLPLGSWHSSFDATATWSIDNVTNTLWQSVRGFPSPGRSWALAFTLRQAHRQ